MQQRKYAAARIAQSQASVDPDDQQADLTVQYDSGPRFTLGPLQISGTKRYPESIIRNVNPLSVGEEYDVNRLLSLQRQIQNTPYFSNAIVGIDNDPENADMAPVKVQVTEFAAQRVATPCTLQNHHNALRGFGFGVFNIKDVVQLNQRQH